MSYTLTFENLNEQDIVEYEKTHNVKFVDFIENLIKPKTKGVKHYSQAEIDLAKEKLNRQFGEFAHLTNKTLSAEEINQGLSEYFAKEWQQ